MSIKCINTFTITFIYFYRVKNKAFNITSIKDSYITNNTQSQIVHA